MDNTILKKRKLLKKGKRHFMFCKKNFTFYTVLVRNM